MQITWECPAENTALLCPLEQVLVNFTIVELEILVNSTQVVLPPGEVSYIIAPVLPGTTYKYTVVVAMQNVLRDKTITALSKVMPQGENTKSEHTSLASQGTSCI